MLWAPCGDPQQRQFLIYTPNRGNAGNEGRAHSNCSWARGPGRRTQAAWARPTRRVADQG
eukprot:scaffold49266_cov33-Phaeocystis_antarctica.AAC.1